jgi:DNA invertase Pin-like site-specific DNA recombinase
MNQRRRPLGDPRLAVAYLRASTTDQRLSPEAQRATILDWGRRERVEVASWHVDQGVSGGCELDERPALAEALGALRAQRAGVLVIAKRDRLARDSGIAIAIERAVAASGASVVSADGVGNGDGPADAFMRRILDAAAEYERALIRARTKAALRAKRERGERAGRVPYGFALGADGRSLIIDERERGILRVVRELQEAGLSIRAIVVECGRRGFVSRVGRPYRKTQVERMLRKVAA